MIIILIENQNKGVTKLVLGDYKYELLIKYFKRLKGYKEILTYHDIEKSIGIKLGKYVELIKCK